MNGHIRSLDGIRASAALMVFVAHVGYEHIVPGGFGVTVFFFLSGYLITTLLRSEIEKTGTTSLRGFYRRRLCRIFPPMYLVLGLTVVLSIFIARQTTPHAVFMQAIHLTNYAHILGYAEHFAPYTGPMWSLAVEEHFYLIFPLSLLMLSIRRSNQQVAIVLAATCALILAWRGILIFALGVESSHTYHASDTRIDSILFGCILALWRNPTTDKSISPTVAAVLLCAGVAALLLTFLIRSQAFRDTLRYTVQGLALMPFFYCAVRFDWWIFRPLQWRVMRAMGLISYMFYLSHLAFIRTAEALFDDQALVVITSFTASVAFSAISYFAIERRVISFGRRPLSTRMNRHDSTLLDRAISEPGPRSNTDAVRHVL